jgi:hypothetical protein
MYHLTTLVLYTSLRCHARLVTAGPVGRAGVVLDKERISVGYVKRPGRYIGRQAMHTDVVPCNETDGCALVPVVGSASGRQMGLMLGHEWQHLCRLPHDCPLLQDIHQPQHVTNTIIRQHGSHSVVQASQVAEAAAHTRHMTGYFH